MTPLPPVTLPSPDLSGQSDMPKRLSPWVGLTLTAILLPLLFPPFYCCFFAPLAIVPFCMCVIRRPVWPRYLFAYYLLGVAFFLPNLFWIGPVTIFGLILLALYLAIYFVVFAWGLHRLVVQFRLPATIAVPVVWTAVEYVRCTFLEGGFPWFMLGNALAPVPVLVQVADLFGVWGVTFLIAMMNGCVVDVLRLPWKTQNSKLKTQNKELETRNLQLETRINPAIVCLLVLNVCAVVLVVAYGVFRLSQKSTTAGPRVAVIQENIPQSMKEDPSKQEENFQRYFRLARAASVASPRPDLIVWPETMIPASINHEILELDENRLTDEGQQLVQKAKRYDAVLRELSTASRVSMLVGVPGYIPNDSAAGGMQKNLTLLYEPGTGPSSDSYAKRHLVPFGEYIPFQTVPLLGPLSRYLIGYDLEVTPGKEWTRFTLKGSTSYTFATPICFEDTMPEPARMMSFDGSRKTDFLLNVSNDGWFQSVELDQHLQADQLARWRTA